MSHLHNSFGDSNAQSSISAYYKERQWYEARQLYQTERASARAANYLLLGSVAIFSIVCAYVFKVLGLLF